MNIRALLLVLMLALAPAAAAQPAGDASPAQALVIQPNWLIPVQDRGQRQDVLPLREIVNMVRARFGGDLISARLEQGGRPVYVLRWRMPNADVQDIRVDAVSGQFR